jgi:hypothetical protein
MERSNETLQLRQPADCQSGREERLRRQQQLAQQLGNESLGANSSGAAAAEALVCGSRHGRSNRSCQRPRSIIGQRKRFLISLAGEYANLVSFARPLAGWPAARLAARRRKRPLAGGAVLACAAIGPSFGRRSMGRAQPICRASRPGGPRGALAGAAILAATMRPHTNWVSRRRRRRHKAKLCKRHNRHASGRLCSSGPINHFA